MSKAPKDINDRFDDPKFILAYDSQIYRSTSLYNVFSNDIPNFDPITSEDLYEFYSDVIYIENKRDFVYSISMKSQQVQVTPLEALQAHSFTRDLYMTSIPYCIKLAEKIKRELMEKYNTENYMTTTPQRLQKTFNLENGFSYTAEG